MHIIFTSLSNKQQCLNLEYPTNFGGSVNLEQRTTHAVTECGDMQFKEMWFEGACLLCSDFNVTLPCTVRLQCNSFCWLMNFILKGELQSPKMFDHTEINLQQGSYHTFYCSYLDVEIAMEKPVQVFTICLTHDYVSKLISKDILPEYFEAASAEPFTLIATDQYAGTRLQSLINDMMQAKQPDYIKRIFLEGKILEILSNQLEKLENQQHIQDKLSKEDIARLNKAKTIVDTNIQTPCSLIELARKTGLNDFKLKKGFKTLFGHTVFGYLAKVRMAKAHQLLQQGYAVSEVSEIVGYKNAHHFTAAFKKRFKLLPSQINKIVVLVLFTTDILRIVYLL